MGKCIRFYNTGMWNTPGCKFEHLSVINNIKDVRVLNNNNSNNNLNNNNNINNNLKNNTNINYNSNLNNNTNNNLKNNTNINYNSNLNNNSNTINNNSNELKSTSYYTEHVSFVINNLTDNNNVYNNISIMMDNGSSIAIIKDIEWLQSLQYCDTTTTITGINANVENKSNCYGYMIYPFEDIKAVYIPNATANIVSQAIIMKYFNLNFNSDNNVYIATHKVNSSIP